MRLLTRALPTARLNVPSPSPSKSLTELALRRFAANRLAIFCLGIVALFALIAIFADWIAPFSPNYMSPTRQFALPFTLDPDFNIIHWLGTDTLGRDIFTLIMYGLRLSLLIGLAVDTLIVVIGVSMGLVAGFFGGLIDNLLMRFTDVMYAFPSLLFAMVVVAALGPSIPSIIFALAAASWVTMARLVRGQVMLTRQMDYVLAAESVGVRPFRLMLRHILPNILGPVIVLAALIVPGAMVAEASLSFLGVGVDPTTPTLGKMIGSSWGSYASHPGPVLFPVFTLALVTLAFTVMGDALRDAFDPRLS